MSIRQREVWVDNVKVFACTLVVLGHFFQSMTKSNILPVTGLYNWFETTIYYFHVPLFFICSGYLYQKYSNVIDGKSWGENIEKKLIALGIPYFVFSTTEWILKNKFSSSVNDSTGRLVNSLLVNPLSPYWYLYALFFLFVLIPTIQKPKWARGAFAIALMLKLIACLTLIHVQILNYIAQDSIWFVAGMTYAFFRYEDKRINNRKWTIAATTFLVISILTYQFPYPVIGFLMGVMGCAVSMCAIKGHKVLESSSFLQWLSSYTLPIFLMHTLCAAPYRVLLVRFGIVNPAIHISGETVRKLGTEIPPHN